MHWSTKPTEQYSLLRCVIRWICFTGYWPMEFLTSAFKLKSLLICMYHKRQLFDRWLKKQQTQSLLPRGEQERHFGSQTEGIGKKKPAEFSINVTLVSWLRMQLNSMLTQLASSTVVVNLVLHLQAFLY